MTIDDEDLERAGTRSRKQLSNPKPYSAYSPVENTTQRTIKKYTLSQLFKNKTKVIVIVCLCLVFLFNFFCQSFVGSKPKLVASNAFEESTRFQDSSQLTDYALLNRLLGEKKVSSVSPNSRFNSNTFNSPSHNSYAHQLARGAVSGHTFDELRRLTNSVSLPITLTSNKQRRVPVTVIIHTKTVAQLYAQAQAVLTQTALAEHVWIICDTDTKQKAEARILTLDKRRVKVMANEDATMWLKTASHSATEFVWVIDQDIVPGKRYLENLLKLSNTGQYGSALLGTEGALFSPKEVTDVTCFPDAMSGHMKSQAVDVINDSWLLHRSWLPYLLGAAEKEKITMMGLFLSRTLYMTAGIPSIALPTDPIERAYWGDVRLQKTQKPKTCKELENMLSGNQDVIYQSLSAKPSILFYVESQEQLNDLAPLICKFNANEQDEIHIVTHSTDEWNQEEIKALVVDLCNDNTMIIHDLGVIHESSDSWNRVNDRLHRLKRILTIVQPKVMIHTVDVNNESINTVSKITNIPTIYLPTQDIPHALWMTELPLSTLSKWNDFTIKIMVNTDKKPHALARLLSSATSAHYFGDNVDLTILMEQTSDRVTQTLVNNYKWKKGNKHVRHRISKVNKASIFVESWYPASNDEYAILLDSELELSPLYYSWAKYSILRYRYQNEHNKHLFGVSLYSPRLLETDPSGRKLLQVDDGPFLMQWPSFVGAVYFPEHWREFHDYITGRHADNDGFEMQNVLVPNLRSNEWVVSWRRYYEELIYLRSYVMLYPNFNGKSLSTLHLELRKQAMRDQYTQAVSLYNVPLLDDMSSLILPELNDLPLLDIYGKLTNIERLKEKGLELHDQISACPVDQQQDYDPTDLLCPYARIVSVTLEHEHDELPTLSTRKVTVYI